MEQTLNNGLNGEEIRIATLDKIATALQRDCFLSKNFTYRGISLEVHIKLKLDDVGGEKEVERTIAHNAGAVGPDAEELEVELGIENEPPNQTRIDTGQPVPVLAKDKDGKFIEKHVQYAKPKPGRAVATAK
jgi:hypothetical protein